MTHRYRVVLADDERPARSYVAALLRHGAPLSTWCMKTILLRAEEFSQLPNTCPGTFPEPIRAWWRSVRSIPS